MPTPSAIFTELSATTFRKHRKQVIDNMSKHTALLNFMMKGKQKKTEDGGYTIAQPLEYAENSTYQRYSGYDVLNVGASDIITAAEFQWRQIAVNVTASGEELRKNSGEARLVNLVKTKIQNAIRTFNNNFSTDLYSDGTLPNQINGLQALVSDTGLGTIGGIDASTWPFWRNKVQSAAAPIQGGGAVTVSSTTIETDLMLPLWMALVRNSDKTNLILADSNYFQLYEKSQLSMKRYTSSDEADGGFDELKYKGARVMYDAGGIPSNRMYFLNTQYFNLVVHQDADLDVLDDMRPYNQDAAVTPILWMGNMTISNRAQQGVLKP